MAPEVISWHQRERLHVRPATRRRARLRRVGSDIEAFERYTADGRMLFRLPMVSSIGRYSVKDNELLIVKPNQTDAIMTTDLIGDTLSLVSEGRTTNYRRVSAGPWYEREHIVRYPPK